MDDMIKKGGRLFTVLSALVVLCSQVFGQQGTGTIKLPMNVARHQVGSADQLLKGNQMSLAEAYGKLPLTFEVNQGQTDSRVKFLSRGSRYILFLTPSEAILELAAAHSQPSRRPGVSGAHRRLGKGEAQQSAVLRVRLTGANPSPETVGLEELPGKSNYFIGKDPSKWRTNVPMYSRVKYRDVYSGIDLVYYGNHRQLEQDFVVRPGADPKSIVLGFQGADKLEVDAQGDLVMHTAAGSIRQQRPFIYQELNGVRQEVPGGYALKGRNQVSFQLASYDTKCPLIIDPVLVYSTYLGGSGLDTGIGIAVDSAGNAYVTGQTTSTDFPLTAGAVQSSFQGGSGDVFVTKLNPTGSGLVYSTYLGGNDLDDGISIAVDSSGYAYVTGRARSTNFPTTPGAFQANFPCAGGANGDCGFVAKLNPTGSGLIYSTYLGGSGGAIGLGIAVDSSGNAYVMGEGQGGFPTTPGAFQTTFQGNGDDWVTKLNPTGSALVYSTYLGGSGGEEAGQLCIAVDASGNAYVTGHTGSTDFPVTAGAFQTASGGGDDAFVTKLNPTGSALIYSTYLGGSGGDYSQAIALDASDNAYVTGLTTSTNFPVTTGAFQTTFGGGQYDAFVTKLNANGSGLVYSTYLGGSDFDESNGIAVDASGNAYVAGVTASTNFPTSNAIQPGYGGNYDAFVTELNPTGSALVYSTYLGGSSFDGGISVALDASPSPNAYVTGQTTSTNFPVTTGAFQTTFGGGQYDAFITKIAATNSSSTTVSSSANPSVFSEPVTFTAMVTGSGTPTGTVTFNDGTAAIGTGTLSGGQATFSTSSLSVASHSITAVYGGDSSFSGSTSSVLTQTVNRASTSTAISSSANPSILNQSVTFTATVKVVAPGAGSPTGTVTFNDGATAVGTATLNPSGQAALTISSLGAGSHSITAVYGGDSNFNGGMSTPLNDQVQYEPAGTMCFGAAGHQILQPINSDGTSVWKQGRTIPAQFRVCDINGISVGTAGVVNSLFLTQIISGTVTNVDETVSSTNPDTVFRWDPTNQQWIFNISTTGLAANSTYVYTITLNDGTTIMFQYGLR